MSDEVKHGARICMGVRVVLCLDGRSDFLLVPGSHLASVPTPAGLLGQGAAAITGPAGDAGGGKFTSNLPFLVIYGHILTDCLWLQCSALRSTLAMC